MADSLISAGSSKASEAGSGELRGPPSAKGLHGEGTGSQHSGQACPPHGAKAICGRRPRMEDAYTAIPFLLEVLVPADVLGQHDILPPRIATQVKSSSESPASSVSDGNDGQTEAQPDSKATADQVASSTALPTTQQSAEAQKGPYVETLHFFGVFDGHGGAEGALHCAQTLHQRIVEAISAHTSPATQREVREQLENSITSTAATEGDMLDTFDESKTAEESAGTASTAGGGDEGSLPAATDQARKQVFLCSCTFAVCLYISLSCEVKAVAHLRHHNSCHVTHSCRQCLVSSSTPCGSTFHHPQTDGADLSCKPPPCHCPG